VKSRSLGICKRRGEDNIKLVLIINRLKMCIGPAWFRINPVVDVSEHSHEILVFVTADFFDQRPGADTIPSRLEPLPKLHT
jgi:hypothetical protein